MKRLRNCATWGFAVVCFVLSPIVLIFAIPLLVGAGLDIFAMAGEGPITVALCAPAVVVLLCMLTPARRQVAAYRRSHATPERVAKLHYAP